MGLREVIAKALQDETFRALLVSSPETAFQGFELNDKEKSMLMKAARGGFQRLQQLDRRVSKITLGPNYDPPITPRP